MSKPLERSRTYRIVGVCSLAGAVLMLVAWFRDDRPGYLISSALQFLGWFLNVTHANRLERAHDDPSSPASDLTSASGR